MCFHREEATLMTAEGFSQQAAKLLKDFFFFKGLFRKRLLGKWHTWIFLGSWCGVTGAAVFPSVLFRWALSTNLSSGVSSSPWRGELDINWNRNLISLRYKSQHTECAALHLQNTVSTKRLLTGVLLSFSELFLYSIPRSAPLEDDTSWRSRGLSALHSTGSLCSTTTFLFFLQGLGFPSQASLPLLWLGHSKLHWWLCGLV